MNQIDKLKAAVAAFAYPLTKEALKNVPVLAPVVGLVDATREAAKKLEIDPNWAVPHITEALVGSELSATDKETVTVMTISALNQAVLEEVGPTAGYTPEEFADRAMEEAERQGLGFGEHKELVRRLMKAFFEAYLAHEDVFNAIGPEKLAEVTEELQRIDRELDGRIWDIYRNASLQEAWRNSVYLLDALAPAEEMGFEAIKTKGGVLRFVETQDFRDTLEQLKEVKKSGKRKIFVMHGAGGHGKTRLWSELGLRLVRDGWRGGFLRPGASFDSLRTIFATETRPLFLVVDYALSRAADFKNVIDAAAGSGWGGALALVLLDRQEVKYVENYRKEQNDPRGSGFGRWLQGVEDAGPVKLRELSEDEAKEIFFGAFADLERLNGGAASDAEDVWRGYAAGLKKRPLHLVLYAYLAVVGALERFSTEGELFEAAINYEVGHWLQAIGVEGDAVPHYEGSLRRMAAVATLAGAMPKDEALQHAGGGCVLEGEAEHYVEPVKLKDALAKMLPCEGGGECIGALEPDPIADYMLNDLLEQDNFECLIEAALPPEDLEDDAQFFARVKHVADVLARAFNQSRAYKMLRPVFASRDPRYAVRVWEMMERWEGGGREELRLDPNAPLVTHVLFPLVLPAVAEYGKNTRGESFSSSHHAYIYSIAGHALVAFGLLDEALEATQRAVKIYGELAEQKPEVYLPDLAGALNNLGAMYSNLNRLDEALEATQRAVEIREELAEQKPEVYLPELARSLGLTSHILNEVGRYKEGFSMAEDGLRKLKDHFFHLPQAYAGLIMAILTDYENARKHCGCEPDMKLVIPIIEKLQELQG